MRMPVRICGLAAGSTSSRKVRGQAERAGGVELHAVDRANAAVGIEQDRKQRSEEDQRDFHLMADADEQHQDR
jgi:hypothetical protein